MRTLMLGVVLGLAGCADKVEGELYIEGQGGDARVFAPSDCFDGETLGFFGVQMFDDDGTTLEFFRDGEDPGVLFHDPGRHAFDLGPRDCTWIEGKLRRKYNRVTNHGRMSGFLEIDCTTPEGARLEGSLSFERCAAPDDDDDDWDGDGDPY